MFAQTLRLVIVAFALSLSIDLEAGAPPNRTWNPANPTNPYGLPELDTFLASDSYAYKAWGTLMDKDELPGTPETLYFTHLTSSPYSSANTQLFISRSLSQLDQVPLPKDFWRDPVGVSDGYVTFLGNPLSNYYLLRKYNYPMSLNNEVTNSAVGSQTRKAVILVHGWNPYSEDNAYSSGNFAALKTNLHVALMADGKNDWSLITYHWEKDSDTGPKSLEAGINGNEAAEAGNRHGLHLGELLDELTDHNIEKVHFVAHSAGSWVVRSATRYLLRSRADHPERLPVKVQVTLLDPFVPGDLNASDLDRTSDLVRAEISAINEFYGATSQSLYRLENYWSKDIAVGTNDNFDWRGTNLDEPGLRLDWRGEVNDIDDDYLSKDPYGRHDGPIRYYGHTVAVSTASIDSNYIRGELAKRNLATEGALNTWGWRRSMFYNEPVISLQPPEPTQVLALGSTWSTSIGATIRGGGQPLSTNRIQYLWQTKMLNGAWTPSPTGSASYSDSFSYTTPVLTSYHNGMKVRCLLYSRAGENTSDEITINVSTSGGTTPVVTAPNAPSGLIATATSSSAISLAWQDKSNNETGFRIERKIGAGGSWVSIVTSKAPNSTTHNDTGLNAETTYFYRVAAFNSAGGGTNFSSEAQARTFNGPASLRDLTVSIENASVSTVFYSSPNPAAIVAGNVLRYAEGTAVTLTAPAVASNGNPFQRWNRNGVLFSVNQAATFVLNGNEILTMVYAQPQPETTYTVSVSPSSSMSGSVVGNGSFGSGAWTTIRATPAQGYSFWNWTSGGQLFSVSAEASFQVTRNLNLVANFISTGGSHVVSVTSNPAAGGSVSGTGSYAYGQVANLVATPADGWTFGTWTENGAILSYSNVLTLPVHQSKDLVASFNPDLSKNYTLAITANNGTAIRSPNQTAYSPGSTVTVTATPHAGYYFTGWSQDANGTVNPLAVTMTGNKKLTGNFAPVPASTYTLEALASVRDGSSGSLTKSPDQAFYPDGSIVQLTAHASPGSIFVGWRGDAYGTSNPFNLVMNTNKWARAQFVLPSPSSSVLELRSPLFSFNVPWTQGGGTGIIRNVAPHGSSLYYACTATVPWIKLTFYAGGIPGGGTGEGSVQFISEENPTLSPRTGQIYVHAPGATNSPQIFTVNQAAGVVQYNLSTDAVNGVILRSPDQVTYPTGTLVTLTATPVAGFAFMSWEGDASGNQNPLTVSMNSVKSITANFSELPKPDIVVQLSLSSDSGPAGSKTFIRGKVRNQGVNTSNLGRIYFRVTDEADTAPTIIIGQAPYVDFGELAANAFQSLDYEIVVPNDLQPGNYHIWAIVDPENQCGEQPSARTNNQNAFPFTVLPDTTLPVIAISTPVTLNSVTKISNISFVGTASDNVALAQITWRNDRGGSGVASGSSTWMVSNVPLQLGDNVINITAIDGAGNNATVLATVTYYPSEPIPPTVAIGFPTSDPTLSIQDDQLSLAGIAEDNFAISQITWSNDRGGNGKATGKTEWVVPSIPLVPGINILSITAEDYSTNKATAVLTVDATIVPGSKDPNLPLVAIAIPKPKARVEGANVIVSGSARAKRGVKEVLWQLEDGPWQLAEGTSDWSFSMDNPPGGIVSVFVKCRDDEGYESSTVNRFFTHVLRSDLALNRLGEGGVLFGGFKAPLGLEIGKNYKLTAKPKKGWVFGGWSGGLVSSQPTITFTMQDSLAVTATFVENPFPKVSGTYLGLASGEPETHSTKGLLRATVTKTGAFSGKLLLGGENSTVKGSFDSNGQWAGEIKRGKAVPFSALLMLDVEGGSDTINGLVSDGTFTAAINTDRATFNPKTNIAPTEGRYTFAIEPAGSDTSVPLGFGVGVLLVDGSGKTTLTGKLADATAITFTSQVSKYGGWPMHVPLYKNTGSITGEMHFADLIDSDSAGGLYWFKPEVPRDTRFKSGFETHSTFLAQAYTAPLGKNLRILAGWDASEGAGSLRVFGPDWVEELLQPIIWAGDNKLGSDQSVVHGLKWTASPKMGLFKGSFLDPTTQKNLPMRGALLQKTSEGLGWFQTTTATGRVLIEKVVE